MIVHPNPDSVAFSIGSLSVHWYGLMYLLGFMSGLMLGRYRASRPLSDFRPDDVMDLLFYIALGVIAGGRLGFVFIYQPAYYLEHPLEIVAIWQGGMSFHGGLIGVAIATIVYAGRTGRGYLAVCDFLAPLIPPGLFFGRLGNFINQELWGRVSDVPWAVLFQLAGPPARHPSQLYEAFLEGLVLFILLWWFSARNRPAGSVAGLFLIGYGAARILVEFFREPDAYLGPIALNWMTMGQLLSIPMILLGLYLMLRSRFN